MPRWLSRRSMAALLPNLQAHPIGRRQVLVAVVAVAAGAAVAVLRVPRALDTTWAEDAHIFLADATARSLWRNLADPYSGYLHTLPRFLAEAAALAPPAVAAAVLSVLAAVCTSLLALVVYVASRTHLRSTAARLAVSVPMLLLPFAQAEMPLSLATLRWQLMYVMFWAMLWQPATRPGRAVLLLVVAFAMTSDNVVILFLPLVLLRWWVLRDWLSAILAALVGLGTVVSIAIPVLGIDHHPGISPRVSPIWAVAAYVVRPVPELLLGGESVGDRPGRGVLGIAVTATAWVLVAVAVLVAWRRRAPRWPLALLAGGYSFVIYILVVMTSGYALARYTAPTAMLILVALVALLTPQASGTPATYRSPARPYRGRSPEARQWLPFSLLAAELIAVFGFNFRVQNVRSDGPLWPDELARARIACGAGANKADLMVSPTGLGWSATLPCDYIRRR
jgi:hypothetical protein